ncbi:MAG: OprD family outer membrane porin [Gammaproteobacteria bacterium]|nr:OprD family outer membrane porin [Gammaproteobacteria bacterium]
MNKRHITACSLVLLATGMVPAWGQDVDGGEHKLQTKVRLVHFDRDFGNDANDRKQTALAFEGNYVSPRFAELVRFGLSAYVVEGISDDGAVTADVLTVDDGELDGYALLGQAYADIALGSGGSAKLGRMLHKSMFLASSGSRAVPNTFQGVSMNFKPTDAVSIYGAVFDRWSSRTSDEFDDFATDTSEEGAIDWVGVAGLRYDSGNYALELEYLRSQDYLSKLGLRGSYRPDLDERYGGLKLTAGVFTSDSDGDLFVTGAEGGDLDDEDAAGAVPGASDSEVNGLGGYLDLEWTRNKFTAGVTLTLIDEIWLEDNFTGDHGTSPFPTTSRAGPDLTNTGEIVLGARIGYDWSDVIDGLSTTFRFADGRDAENSVSPALGTADEQWWEIDVRYKVSAFPGLAFRGIYHDYKSDESGSVDGVKDDDRDIRLYLDYTYKF